MTIDIKIGSTSYAQGQVVIFEGKVAEIIGGNQKKGTFSIQYWDQLKQKYVLRSVSPDQLSTKKSHVDKSGDTGETSPNKTQHTLDTTTIESKTDEGTEGSETIQVPSPQNQNPYSDCERKETATPGEINSPVDTHKVGDVVQIEQKGWFRTHKIFIKITGINGGYITGKVFDVYSGKTTGKPITVNKSKIRGYWVLVRQANGLYVPALVTAGTGGTFSVTYDNHIFEEIDDSGPLPIVKQPLLTCLGLPESGFPKETLSKQEFLQRSTPFSDNNSFYLKDQREDQNVFRIKPAQYRRAFLIHPKHEWLKNRIGKQVCLAHSMGSWNGQYIYYVIRDNEKVLFCLRKGDTCLLKRVWFENHHFVVVQVGSNLFIQNYDILKNRDESVQVGTQGGITTYTKEQFQKISLHELFCTDEFRKYCLTDKVGSLKTSDRCKQYLKERIFTKQPFQVGDQIEINSKVLVALLGKKVAPYVNNWTYPVTVFKADDFGVHCTIRIDGKRYRMRIPNALDTNLISAALKLEDKLEWVVKPFIRVNINDYVTCKGWWGTYEGRVIDVYEGGRIQIKTKYGWHWTFDKHQILKKCTPSQQAMKQPVKAVVSDKNCKDFGVKMSHPNYEVEDIVGVTQNDGTLQLAKVKSINRERIGVQFLNGTGKTLFVNSTSIQYKYEVPACYQPGKQVLFSDQSGKLRVGTVAQCTSDGNLLVYEMDWWGHQNWYYVNPNPKSAPAIVAGPKQLKQLAKSNQNKQNIQVVPKPVTRATDAQQTIGEQAEKQAYEVGQIITFYKGNTHKDKDKRTGKITKILSNGGLVVEYESTGWRGGTKTIRIHPSQVAETVPPTETIQGKGESEPPYYTSNTTKIAPAATTQQPDGETEGNSVTIDTDIKQESAYPPHTTTPETNTEGEMDSQKKTQTQYKAGDLVVLKLKGYVLGSKTVLCVVETDKKDNLCFTTVTYGKNGTKTLGNSYCEDDKKVKGIEIIDTDTYKIGTSVQFKGWLTKKATGLIIGYTTNGLLIQHKDGKYTKTKTVAFNNITLLKNSEQEGTNTNRGMPVHTIGGDVYNIPSLKKKKKTSKSNTTVKVSNIVNKNHGGYQQITQKRSQAYFDSIPPMKKEGSGCPKINQKTKWEYKESGGSKCYLVQK